MLRIYAQGLEKLGYKIDRQMRIGQREIYMPELKAGAIDLLPDYTGNLLQFFKPESYRDGVAGSLQPTA